MIKRPKLLIVFAKHGSDTSTRFGGFVKRIQKNGGFAYADVDYVALEDLLFHIKNPKEATVTSVESDVDIANYAFVYFKSWQSMRELAAAAALYLEAKGVPYADFQASMVSIVKSVNYMAMWKDGVAVPETIWGSKKALSHYLSQTSESRYPLIIKASDGEKGKDNYLVKTRDHAMQTIDGSTVDMVMQQFIPNDGDYRIGVYGGKARWSIYRKSGGTSHLNNTSAGGTAELLDVSQLDKKIITLAEAAAQSVELSISGVDVVENKETKELYILEANQGSQIVTGMFTESNMQAFDDGMRDMMMRRYAPAKKKKLQIIGRHANVVIEGIEQPISLVAKIDTGAYQSSLHAENIRKVSDEAGKEYLEYDIHDPQTDLYHTIRTHEYWRALVRNSTGVEQERYVVPMKLRVNGKVYATRVSLADRSTQKYLLLIGRKLLRGNFMVNVELGFKEGASL